MASLFRTRFSSLAARASSSPPLSAALNRRVVVAASSQNYSNTNRLPQRRNVVTLTTNITATPPTSITFTRTLQPPYHSRNPLFTSCSQQFPANMAIKVIQSTDEYSKIVNTESANRLVVIDFFATWCGPCRAIAPVMEKLSEDFSDVSFYKIDVDAHTAVAKSAEIHSMPTFLFFKNGEKKDQVTGANPSALKTAIERNK